MDKVKMQNRLAQIRIELNEQYSVPKKKNVKNGGIYRNEEVISNLLKERNALKNKLNGILDDTATHKTEIA